MFLNGVHISILKNTKICKIPHHTFLLLIKLSVEEFRPFDLQFLSLSFLISYSWYNSVFPENWKLDAEPDSDSRLNSFDKDYKRPCVLSSGSMQCLVISFYDASSHWCLILIFINSTEGIKWVILYHFFFNY